jgi:Dolichyl-phosphate-mannose-protein mannosyltransferase
LIPRVVPERNQFVQPNARANLRLLAIACAVGVAILLGLVARLQGITASLWVDEFGTLWVVDKSLRDVVQRAIQVQGQTPLYYTLVWGALKILGESEFALRATSVLAATVATALIWRAARMIAGNAAGTFAATLFWFSPAVISVSASARPYALGLCCASVAMLGFAQGCQSGSRRGRLLFVFGSAALFWTHYLMSLVVGGLVLSYLVAPALRFKYPWRSLFADLLLIGALLLPTLPQWLSLTTRRGSLAWSTSGPTIGAFGPVLPFLAIGLLALLARRRDSDRVRPAIVLALWLAVATQVGLLALATIVGVNLLIPRFLIVAIVPASIVAGVGLSRLGLPIGVVITTTVLALAARDVRMNHRVIDSFSGAGFQQWREAVDDLATEIRAHPDAPVLYRSGFVEDDLPPLSEPAPMSLAPLRSPGHQAPRLRILLMPFRWSNPQRMEYMDAEIAPQLSQTRQFFFVGPPITEPDAGSFTENLQAFVRTRWPNRFRVSTVSSLRGLVLLRFSADE